MALTAGKDVELTAFAAMSPPDQYAQGYWEHVQQCTSALRILWSELNASASSQDAELRSITDRCQSLWTEVVQDTEGKHAAVQRRIDEAGKEIRRTRHQLAEDCAVSSKTGSPSSWTLRLQWMPTELDMSLSCYGEHLVASQNPTEDSGSPVGTLMDRLEAVQSELNGWRARKSKRLEEHGALQAGTPAWAVWQTCWNIANGRWHGPDAQLKELVHCVQQHTWSNAGLQPLLRPGCCTSPNTLQSAGLTCMSTLQPVPADPGAKPQRANGAPVER